MRFVIILAFLPLLGKAQIDSAMTIPLLGVNFGGQLPLFDLANRFGPNLNVGGSFVIKTKKNWVFGIESNYLFGKNVKEDVLKQMKNTEGFIVDNQGNPADLRVTERGLGIHLIFGKVLGIGHNNPNSGIIVTFGVGYLQHKINLYDAQTRIAAVKGPLKYGYDRLTAGISFSQFIGYLYLSENRLLNFYFGFEMYEAFTKSIRKLNYDTGLPDTRQRFDGLNGLRLGWILPLYKKKPNDFYYN
jgi:hypothetical protein